MDVRQALEHGYLHNQANARYEEAKKRLAKFSSLSDRRDTQSLTRPGSTRRDALVTHLQLLRQQKQVDNLRTLSYYSSHAEQIANDHALYDQIETKGYFPQTELNSDSRGSEVDNLAEAQSRVNGLQKVAQDLTSELELALVKARQELKREQFLLNDTGAEIEDERNGGTANELAKLVALETARHELQSWIAETLAKCEERVPTQVVDHVAVGSSTLSNAGEAQRIEAAYGEYVEARRRVLQTSTEMKSSLSPTNAVKDSAKQGVASSVHSHLTHTRQPSQLADDLNELPKHSLSSLQHVRLPEYHHEKLVNTYLPYLRVQTRVQDVSLLQALGLLSHESHLLASHPLSAPEANTNSTTSSQHQGESDQLLRAWAFASQEAKQSLGDLVQKHVAEGRLAIEDAEDSIEGLAYLSEMKELLLK